MSFIKNSIFGINRDPCVKDLNWEWDFADAMYWLQNRRRHQVDDEVFELASEGRSSRTWKEAQVNIEEQLSKPSASTQGCLVNIFCAWLKWD